MEQPGNTGVALAGQETDPDAQARAEKRARQLAGLRPWQKGQSGNPGGRPKGLAARIREMTSDGDDILSVWVGAMHGRLPDGEPVRARDRLEAASHLALRLWGKPLETTIHLDANRALEQGAGLSPDLLEHLARALLPSATVVPARLERGGELAQVGEDTPNPTETLEVATKTP